VSDLRVDTTALSRAAAELRGVSAGAAQARSRVGAWREPVAVAGVGDGRARAAVEEFADRWAFGLGLLRDDAEGLAYLLARAAAVFEAVESRLTPAATGDSTAPGAPVAAGIAPVSRTVTAERGAPYGPWREVGTSSADVTSPWWMQLALADDPRWLVAGDPGLVEALAAGARRFALDAAQGAAQLRSLVLGGWVGTAAETFASEASELPVRLDETSGAFGTAATALSIHAEELSAAQVTAQRAMEEWALAESATRAVSPMDAQMLDWGGAPGQQVPEGSGSGAEYRDAAQRLLAAAQGRASESAEVLASALRRAGEAAPRKHGFLSKVGRLLGVAAGEVGHDLVELGASTLNVLASVGNAALQHPEDLAAIAAGLALMSVSAGGEATGLALSATGVGAVAGVPLGAISAVGIAAGASLTAAATADLGNRAAGGDRVSPIERGVGQSKVKAGTKTDRLKEHLTDNDLEAARREINGEVVKYKGRGQPWDHVDEVRNAQRGLANRVQALQRQLGDSRLSATDRVAAESELSEASRLLDHSESYLPRP
jgi:hypothetical protein